MERLLERQSRSHFLLKNQYRRSYQFDQWQVKFWLASGEVTRAAEWAERVARAKRQESPLARDREDTTRVRVALAQGHAAQALTVLNELLPQSRLQERRSHLIEQLALQALAYRMQKHDAAAFASLTEALQLGAPAGYIRSFVDAGAAVADVLLKLPVTPYRDRVLAAFSDVRLPIADVGSTHSLPIQNLKPKIQHAIEPLTEREREVLQLLAKGATNQEIADTLVVASSTVKNHLSRIFGKLGVGNRTQAVAHARTLGLLDDHA
ncbi:MAG: response regulator transcription factor [Blastochloris sp.]|nr:response regulator transcription factor [Blastochloris sp.]